MDEATVLAAAEAQLADGRDLIEVGLLAVTTGRLFCCDPFRSAEAGPLDRPVPVGEHRVRLGLIDNPPWGRRIGFAALVISGAPVVRWDAASFRHDGQTRRSFEVEAGLACFMDEAAEQQFRRAFGAFYREHPDGNFYDDALAASFLKSARFPGHSGDFCLYRPAGDGPNVAMFASGLGDGVYSACWGLDQHDVPCRLLVDFGVGEGAG